MRILWVKIGGLWPLNIGGRLRSYHIVSALSERHRVVVLTTHPRGVDGEELAKHLSHCERVVSFAHDPPKAGTARFAWTLAQSWFSALPVDLYKVRVPELQHEVQRLLQSGSFDLCVADFLFAVPNVAFGQTPVVLFEHNVESMIWRRLAEVEKSAWRRALLQIESRKVERAEQLACKRSRMVIAVSDEDRIALQRGALNADVRSVPTGVDIGYFTANGTPERPHHLVFTGAMDWYPNEDAMLFFIANILPDIRREIPAVTMSIVGRNPSQRLEAAAAAAGVHLTGTVPDVRPFIDEAAVYVVPIRIGGGTRLKIFEALSMAKAVVPTTVGTEGLPLLDREHYVRADGPREFSGAVVSLLRDRQQRQTLAAAGSRFVRSNYAWTSVARSFEALCEEAIA